MITIASEKQDRLRTLLRGLLGRCPCCGEGRLFRSYLKPHASCEACGLRLDQFRADDAPAYFTILIVGHVVVPAMLSVEVAYHPSALVQCSIWLPLTLGMTLGLLPRIKGALIALMWSLKAPS